MSTLTNTEALLAEFTALLDSPTPPTGKLRQKLSQAELTLHRITELLREEKGCP